MKYLWILLLTSINPLLGQHDLSQDAVFFESRISDYQSWLVNMGYDRYMNVEKIVVGPDKLTLYLKNGFQGTGNCDSLQAAWSQLRKQFYTDTRQALHSVMLEKLCFQMDDLPFDSAEINLQCSGSKFSVRIYGEKMENGRIVARMEEIKDESMGSDVIHIPIEQVKDIYRNKQTKLNQKDSVDIRKVRRAVGKFFYDKYQYKGTKWLWTAKIDTTNTYFNEFSYKISQISGEILLGRNFFELHYINVKIEEVNKMLTISWSFQGKYGGGLIYSPREASSDYHDIETSQFKNLFDIYQKNLFRQLEEYLRR